MCRHSIAMVTGDALLTAIHVAKQVSRSAHQHHVLIVWIPSHAGRTDALHEVRLETDLFVSLIVMGL